MNFKTTIILIVLLAAALVFVFFARDTGPETPGGSPVETTLSDDLQGKKIFQITSAEVSSMSISTKSGEKLSLVRRDGQWQIESPIKWLGDQWAVSGLIDSIVDLRSRGLVELDAESRAAAGLAEPLYTIDFSDGSTARTLYVGGRSGLGSDVYAQFEKKDRLVTGGSLAGKLEEGIDKLVADLRDKKLVNLAATDVKQLEIDRPGGKITLHKTGAQWSIVGEPPILAESSAVDDLLFSLTALRGEEFISGNAPAGARLDAPRATIYLSGEPPAPPSSQPTTTPATRPAGTIIEIGQFTDIQKQQTFVRVSPPDVIAKSNLAEPAWKKITGANSVSLRSLNVFEIDPEEVSSIRIESERLATTQPTTQPASTQFVQLTRRAEAITLRPDLPTTLPATTPTTTPATQPAGTEPVDPPSRWQVATQVEGATILDADDVKVGAILAVFRPLRAERYVEAISTDGVAARHTIIIKTQGPGGAPEREHRISLAVPAEDKPLQAEYDSMKFELPRAVLTQIEQQYAKQP